MQNVDYMEVADKAMKKIIKGAFLTVKAGDALNTMTIGWATIGYVWRNPVFMVAVRLSRHTFGIIEKADDFTVSIPSNDMKEQIAFCGTKSGRDYDKFEACNLETSPGERVTSPIIKAPGIHYECKIVFKAAMDPQFLDEAYDSKLYPEKDYHTLYFGEIQNCYVIE
jgi:flavin reductase (DIM6/NTAB) family NADH-FMN oxidoreductase RutF